MRVHFLVLTHERPEGLRTLLASVRRQRHPQADIAITVLDNASSQPAAQHAEAACQQMNATYVLSPVNSMMRGKRVLEDLVFAEATAPNVIVHLDDDVVLSDAWLTEVLEPLQHSRFAACGSVETWDHRLIYSGQRHLQLREIPVGEHTVKLWDWQWQDVDTATQTVPVEFAGHRALAVLAEVADAVRHDPQYLIGGEDLDYSLALRRHSCSIGIATNAVIQHRAAGEQDATGFRTAANVIPSWRHFYRKWGFIRANACHEAGLTLEEFARTIINGEDDDRRAAA